MADHVYLSLWLREPSTLALPQYLERALGVFPFSRFRTGATLRVLAVSLAEPPLLERLYDEIHPGAMLEDAQAFLNSDIAYEVDCFWELWHKDPDWTLQASPVTLTVSGPDFERDSDEQITIDLGAETLFLPEASTPLSLRPIQSNVRSVLRLADDLARVLPVERRSLWAESGESLAQRFEDAI